MMTTSIKERYPKNTSNAYVKGWKKKHAIPTTAEF